MSLSQSCACQLICHSPKYAPLLDVCKGKWVGWPNLEQVDRLELESSQARGRTMKLNFTAAQKVRIMRVLNLDWDNAAAIPSGVLFEVLKDDGSVVRVNAD